MIEERQSHRPLNNILLVMSMGKKKSLIRELINKGLWSNEKSLYEIVIVHRGVKGNRISLRLDEINGVRDGYIIVGDTLIPLHRVVEIRYKGKVLLKRKHSITGE